MEKYLIKHYFVKNCQFKHQADLIELQSHSNGINCRNFNKQVISELCSTWKDIKTVHVKPHHSQSQSSVEITNQNKQTMLTS